MSKQTYINYQRDLKEFDNYLKRENISFDEIDHIVIRGFNSYLLNKNNSKRTLSRKNSSLRSYFRFLIKNHYADKDPFLFVERVKIDKRLPEVLTLQEIIELLNIEISENKDINIRNKALVHLLYSSGTRASEIANIKLDDIDLDNDVILVNGKGNKQRYVLVNEDAKHALINYLENSRNNLIQLENNYLFLNKFGNPLNKRSIENILSDMGKAMKTPKRVYPHIIRHSFATHLLDGGADLRSIQELLGHESIEATQVYTHLSNQKLQENYRNAHPHSKINK